MTPTLLGIPFDERSSFMRGAAGGPAAIRSALASSSSNMWTESLRDLSAPNMLHDVGDVVASLGEEQAAIEQRVRELLNAGAKPIILGGDHSITYPVIRAIRSVIPHFDILHIDAHADLYPDFDGDPLSHACPFARIMENELTSRLVQVGIRTLNDVQRAQADKFKVEIIDMRRWHGGHRPKFSRPVYISLDLDGIDPGFAPGVSHREPGGLSPREVIDLIQSLRVPIIGADVVELNPTVDPANITAPLAAKLVKEIADRMLS